MPKKTSTAEPEQEEQEQGADVVIAFNGAEFTVPRDPDDWPTTAYIARITAMTTSQLPDWLEFIRLLLGDQQWDRLTTVNAGRAGDFKEFVDVFATTVKAECGL